MHNTFFTDYLTEYGLGHVAHKLNIQPLANNIKYICRA